jgi:hypothetical protein
MVAAQTYHTLRDMRVVFADGSVLDTADPESRQAFLKVDCFPVATGPLVFSGQYWGSLTSSPCWFMHASPSALLVIAGSMITLRSMGSTSIF